MLISWQSWENSIPNVSAVFIQIHVQVKDGWVILSPPQIRYPEIEGVR